jgi:hypothetical protein
MKKIKELINIYLLKSLTADSIFSVGIFLQAKSFLEQ